MVEELSEDEIKQLKRTARKLLMDESISDEEKGCVRYGTDFEILMLDFFLFL